MQAVPDAHVLPGTQPPMRGAARAAHLLGHVVPAAAGGQDIPQDAHDDAVGDGWATTARSGSFFGRKMVADEVEERFGHLGARHGCDSFRQTPAVESSNRMPN